MVSGKFPPENSYPSNSPPGEFPLGKFPPGILPTTFLNIPTRVFKFFFHYCHRYDRYYFKNYFVILCFKSAEARLVTVFQKMCSLSAKMLVGQKILLVKYNNRSLV